MERGSISSLYCVLSSRYLFRPYPPVAMQSAGPDSTRNGQLHEWEPLSSSDREVRTDTRREISHGSIGPMLPVNKTSLASISLQEHLKALVETGLLVVAACKGRTNEELTTEGFLTLDMYSSLLDAVNELVAEPRA